MLNLVNSLKNKLLYRVLLILPLIAALFAFCSNNEIHNDYNPILSPDTVFNRMSMEQKIMQLYIYEDDNPEAPFDKTVPQGISLSTNSFHQLRQRIAQLSDDHHHHSDQPKPIVITEINKPFNDLPVYMNHIAVLTTRDTALFRIWAEQTSDSLAKAGVTAVKGFFADFSSINARTTDKELFAKTAQARTAIEAFWQNGITVVIQSSTDQITDRARRTFVKKSIDSLTTLGKRLKSQFNTEYPDNALTFKHIDRTDEIISTIASNADIITGSFDPHLFLKTVEQVLKKNKRLRKIIDLKAYKIVKLKYWIDENHPQRPERNLQTRLAVWKAITGSNTCIYNTFGFLPVKDVTKLKIVQIGGTYLKGFVSEKYNYCDANMQYVDNNFEAVQKALKKTYNKDLVILINDKLSDIKVITQINNATRNNHSCVINFGNTDNLDKIKSSSLLQVYGNGFASGKFAAQALFGSLEVNGRAPVQLAHDIKAGTGKKIEVCRLQTLPLNIAGFNPSYCDTIDSIINMAISKNCFPGCQVFAAYKGKILINKGYGHYTYDTTSQAVTTNTMYDIASLTKITAATIIMMHLSGKKMLDLDKNMGEYFRDTTIDWTHLPADTIINPNDNTDTTFLRDIPERTIFGVPVRLLLEHKSGIYPYLPFTKILYYRSTKRRMLKDAGVKVERISADDLKQQAFDEFFTEKYTKRVAETKICENLWLKNVWRDSVDIFTRRLSVEEKKEYKYSDINMILLQKMAEEMLGTNADDFLQKNFYKPLGMYRTHYNPTRYYDKSLFAPTAPNLWTGEILQGDVHDPSAEILGGVSGNAGIFSTAKDLGVLFQMVLNKGTYGRTKYLEPDAIKQYTTKQPKTGRALGFDMYPSAYCADSASVKTFGHTGFTGTCAWVDPENEIVIVFLSNRVYPDEKNQNLNKYRIRKLINQAVYNGIANANK